MVKKSVALVKCEALFVKVQGNVFQVDLYI
jgi:hypothetical protein